MFLLYEVIILMVYDVVMVKIERVIYLYWDYFENNWGDKCKKLEINFIRS